ncbi:MAG: metallophosphoesterase [Oscillospiraceae bacterium]|nr:metallophosphoesterase [Oscillospiraceae bacterium]
MKKVLSIILALALAIGAAAAFAEGETDVKAKVYADWKFNEASVVEGTSIAGGNLQLKDASGNGNTLELNVYNGSAADLISFENESIIPGQGSMLFKSENSNDSSARAVRGVDFTTVSGAPINKETFDNGYTIEILYKMPDDWNNTDRWTSLLSRVGTSDKIDSEYSRDGVEASTLISVSNCKEIQFIPLNSSNTYSPGSVWSIAMDKAENWYSIVITCDGNEIRSYVNGAASFRDYTRGNMKGLYADPKDGRFRIGARVRDNTKPYRFTRGYIQEIKISEGVLGREDWLVPNPEDYLGEYGNNEDFAETPEDRYNFVFLPDVQNTVEFMPDVLYKAMDWMVENQDYANISAVLGLGDNVNNFWVRENEWENVSKAMKILTDGGVKLLMMPGNHDTTNGSDTNEWYYHQYFGRDSQYLKDADYVTNDSPSGFSSYMKAQAGSYTYLLLAVGMFSYGQDEAWIRRVLEENSSLPTILISHDLQNCSDTVPNEIKLSGRGNDIWNIAKQYDNVFMMVGGHSHGYGTEVLKNNYGHEVFSILADYQFSFNGGNALFKFAEFDERGGKIHVSTFSPYVQTLAPEEKSFFDVNYMTGKGNDDILDINFSKRFAFATKETTYGDNLIENFSFEENTEGWTYNNGGQTGPLSGWVRSSEQAHDGSWSLKQAANVGSADNANLGTYFPITGGKKYKLTYWEYNSVAQTGGFNRMHAAVAVTGKGGMSDASLQLIDCGGWSSWSGRSPRDPDYLQGWTQRSYIIDTTDHPEAQYILFGYAWGDTAPFYIDDFSLVEVTESYPVSINSISATKTDDGVSVWTDITNVGNRDFCYIAAGYNAEGKLVALSCKTGLSGAADAEVELKAQGIATVKVFCWDDLASIQSLCESGMIKIE